MIFRKFGGSYQYWVRTPGELPTILELDPALWAALSVPVTAINADRRFLEYLDCDGNGMIRIDDVTAAVRLTVGQLKSLEVLADPAPELPAAALADPALAEFLNALPELAENGRLRRDRVAARLAEVAAGPFRGDGVLRLPAVAGSGAEALFEDVRKAAGAADGITAAQLEKFIADAGSFLDWARQTERPQFRGGDPGPGWEAFHAVREKVEEFFRFCELIRLDPANARRFQLDPDHLPPLDLGDPAAVSGALLAAPLAAPNRAAELDFDGELNPGYREALLRFAGIFGVRRLDPAGWAAIRRELAPYAEYLDRAQGDNIGRLGAARLEAVLAGGQPETLRQLLARDGRLGEVLGRLRLLEKLILFKQYLLPFVNNFVCFKALFSPRDTSMLQAGRLIMDGRAFALTLWIRSVAEHKAIAVKSNLCLLYLELTPPAPGAKLYVATAVTGGDLKRIYIGKPAFFIDSAGRQYCGRVVDLVVGPISFWQTILAPFRRLAALIGDKVQKLTDFASVEKELGRGIDTAAGKLAAPPGAAPAPALAAAPAARSGWFGNGSMLLLAGGISLAALGAAASYAVRTAAAVLGALSAMPPLELLLWIAGIGLAIFIPMAIHAVLQLRKRNLTLFLEAAGWAVNLPMRLNSHMSRLFTRGGSFPAGSEFRPFAVELPPAGGGRKRRLAVLLAVLALAAAAAVWRWFAR